MFDFAFQKFFENFLTILKFFSLLQINIFFYVFVLFLKNMLSQEILKILIFFFISKQYFFLMFLYYFLNKIY
jgi:hypothetical protein